MNKWGLLAVFVLLIAVVIFPFIAQDATFSGDIAQVDPILQTINLGDMRIEPAYAADNPDKGVRAYDVIAETTKQVLETNQGKFADEYIIIDFDLVDIEGNEVNVDSVKDKIINPLVKEVGYVISVYNKQAFTDSNTLKADAKPLTSTQYRWEVYTDAAEDLEAGTRAEVLPSWLDEGATYNGTMFAPVDIVTEGSGSGTLTGF